MTKKVIALVLENENVKKIFAFDKPVIVKEGELLKVTFSNNMQVLEASTVKKEEV